jgi:hypothetical protein
MMVLRALSAGQAVLTASAWRTVSYCLKALHEGALTFSHVSDFFPKNKAGLILLDPMSQRWLLRPSAATLG